MTEQNKQLEQQPVQSQHKSVWEAKVGPHVGRLIIFVTYGLVALVFYMAGQKDVEFDLVGNNNILLHDDSMKGHEEEKITQERKNAIKIWLKHNDPVLPDGTPNPEWLLIMERERTIARERSDQTPVIRKTTNMLEDFWKSLTAW